tara:strand:- start:2358 stop:2753 length:396 start_codon:yes stop_codon:yes gene_type:complete
MSAIVLKLIGSLFEPAANLIDNLHTSGEEKLKAKQDMFDSKTEITFKFLDYEARMMEMRGGIIAAEAKSEHTITAIWRPVTMLTFLLLVILDSFALLPNPLSEEAWVLLKIGLGGYVVGRSGEKITELIKK